MNTYEQQLKEILNPKGCGLQRFNDFNDTWEICTNSLTNNKIDEVRKLIYSSIVEAKYCPKCKAIQKAQKETLLMCAKNELEFLEDWTLPTFNDTPERKYHNDRINTRISQLQEVIKKLEEMK